MADPLDTWVGFASASPLPDSRTAREMGTEVLDPSASQVWGRSISGDFAGLQLPRFVQQSTLSAAELGLGGVESELPFTPPEWRQPVQPEPMMSGDEANAEFGVPGVLNFNLPISRARAQLLHDQKVAAAERDDILRRNQGSLIGGGARAVTGLAIGALDPLNIAASFIPVPGVGALGTRLLAAAGERALARAGARAVVGGITGAVGTAALQPLEYGLSRAEWNDYTMSEALRNIAFGTVLGGGLHAAGGYIGDRLRNPFAQRLEQAGPEVREDALKASVAEVAEGRDVNVAPLIEYEIAARTEADLAREARRQQTYNVGGGAVRGAENLFDVARREQQVNEIAATMENPFVEGTRRFAEREQRNRDAARSMIIPEPRAADTQPSGVVRPTEAAPAVRPTVMPSPPAETATFTTAKGSTYAVHPDGTTTRNKSFHPEHGAADQGLQPRSDATIYITKEEVKRLGGRFQAQGGATREIVPLGDGRWGMRYVDGKDAGKFERDTVVTPKLGPEPGLTPVEMFQGGRRVHFGNEITQVGPGTAAPIAQPRQMVPIQGPAFAREAIARGWEMGNRLGVVDDIERLAAEGKRAPEIVAELGSRLDRVRELARANNESERQAAEQLVRNVRVGLGIPSIDQATEFAAWLAAYRARAGAPAPAVAITPTPTVATARQDTLRAANDVMTAARADPVSHDPVAEAEAAQVQERVPATVDEAAAQKLLADTEAELATAAEGLPPDAITLIPGETPIEIIPGRTPGTFRTEITIGGKREVIEGRTSSEVAAKASDALYKDDEGFANALAEAGACLAEIGLTS
jgi:hypothetical protein